MVKAINKTCEEMDDYRPLLDIIQSVLPSIIQWNRENLPTFIGFASALALDGFEVHENELIPTTSEPAILAPELTALEEQLQERGMTIAITHYRQACENFVRGNAEAANGQIRSFLENLFIALCEEGCDRRFPDATAAL
jgi:hypothetical protein